MVYINDLVIILICVFTPANKGFKIKVKIRNAFYIFSITNVLFDLGIQAPGDLSKPIDKKLYKGTNPSCHDFNEATALNDGAPLLVGFTTGQIQLVQPGKREPGRLYNEDVSQTYYTKFIHIPRHTNVKR